MARGKKEDPEDQRDMDWGAAEREALAKEAEEGEGEFRDDAPDKGAEVDDPSPPAVPSYPRVPLGTGPESAGKAAPSDPPAAGLAAPVGRPLSPHAARLQTFGEIFRQALPQFSKVIPKGVDPNQLLAVALGAVERNPGLLECTGISVLRGILIAGQLGLDASGVGGMGYLVPYTNKKTNKREAQFIIGYKGMVELARRGGVAWIHAAIVYQNEKFKHNVDPIPRVYHEPYPLGATEEERGPSIGVYAVAIFKDQSVPPQPIVMANRAVERIRSISQSAKFPDSPWNKFPEEMYKKTAVRALCKMLPQGPLLASAIDLEDRQEMGEVVTLPGEMEVEEIEKAPPATTTRRLNEKLKKKPS